MAIYCIQCGTSMPADANFCLKCGKQMRGSGSNVTSYGDTSIPPSKGTHSPSSVSTPTPSEIELYRGKVANVFKTAVGENEWKQEYGGGTCIVTNRKLTFETKKGAFRVFLRDIDGVRFESNVDFPFFFIVTHIIYLDGFGYLWTNTKEENIKLASEIKKAMQQS